MAMSPNLQLLKGILPFCYLADPGKAGSRGCSTNTSVADSFIHSFIHPLVKISLWRRHTQTVNNGDSSLKTNYVYILSEILNLEGHQNRWIGSKVTTILLSELILPTGGAKSGRVCACSMRSRLVSFLKKKTQLQAQTLPDEAPPMGKINPFSKIAITFEPVMQFAISIKIVT